MSGISRTTLSKFLSGQRKYLRIDIIEYIYEKLFKISNKEQIVHSYHGGGP